MFGEAMNFNVLFDAGVTQGELAKILHTSRVTVNHWVNGKVTPSRFVSRRLALVMAAIEAAFKAGELPIFEKHDRLPLLKKTIAKYITH